MSRNPSSLAELLGGHSDHDRDDERNERRTPPDVLCVTLKEVAARYAEPCPFKVGDLVTPRRGSSIKNAGEPNIVIATRPGADYEFAAEPGSSLYGKRFDLRVAHEARGTIFAHWVEAAEFEPYVGSAASQVSGRA